jgi:hypothetical protein
MRLLFAALFLLATSAHAVTDVEFVQQTVERVHPGLAHSCDPEQFGAALAALPAAPAPTRHENWRRWATLNPLLADAHLFIGMPDWRGEFKAHHDAGGSLFPYEVSIDGDDRLFVRARLGGEPAPYAGEEITAINGIPARKLVSDMLLLTHGDSPQFRRHLLARRWWLYHWKTQGTEGRYRIALRRHGLQASAGSTAVPQVLREEDGFANQFSFRLADNHTAVLTANTFVSEDKERFVAWTRDAFQRMRDAGTQTLIIDISANGGGDDAMWLEGLMPYLADKPFRTGSTYRKRDSATGQLIQGEIATWHQPQTGNPLRFQGKVYVVVGLSTYSSAVLFANVMQDFGFATLAGTGGGARTAQTGGVRRFDMPQSGLALYVPRFVLDRPAGARGPAWLKPDIGLPAEGAVERLLRGLNGQSRDSG